MTDWMIKSMLAVNMRKAVVAKWIKKDRRNYLRRIQVLRFIWKSKCSRWSDNNPMSQERVQRACFYAVVPPLEFRASPGLTAPSSAQTGAPVAGSHPLMSALHPSSPREPCSFSSSSPSLSFSSRPSLPLECHLCSLPPHFSPFPSCPPSFSSSSCPLRWLPGLPSSSLGPNSLSNRLNLRINSQQRTINQSASLCFCPDITKVSSVA